MPVDKAKTIIGSGTRRRSCPKLKLIECSLVDICRVSSSMTQQFCHAGESVRIEPWLNGHYHLFRPSLECPASGPSVYHK